MNLTFALHFSILNKFLKYQFIVLVTSAMQSLVSVIVSFHLIVLDVLNVLANDMRTFLLQWYKKFPELSSRDLFLTGESYAGLRLEHSDSMELMPRIFYLIIFLAGNNATGHYIPQLANVLLNYNKHSTDFKFKLKGIAVSQFTI